MKLNEADLCLNLECSEIFKRPDRGVPVCPSCTARQTIPLAVFLDRRGPDRVIRVTDEDHPYDGVEPGLARIDP
jgi:hypothetical protein